MAITFTCPACGAANVYDGPIKNAACRYCEAAGAGSEPRESERVLCPDEACIGIIGPDGACTECGRLADGSMPDVTIDGVGPGSAKPEAEIRFGPDVDRYHPYKGRFNRKTWYQRSAALVGPLLLLMIIAYDPSELWHYLCILLACQVSTISFSVKRAHDLGKPGWFAALTFIPVVNIWPYYEFAFLKGTDGSNEYGPEPIGTGVVADQHKNRFGGGSWFGKG